MVNSPCKGCDHRHVDHSVKPYIDCHKECDAYIKFRNDIEAEKQAKKNFFDAVACYHYDKIVNGKS